VTDDVGYAKELSDLGSAVAPGRVSIFPDLSRSEKEELLKKAYAFVLPSPIEGFSLATLESMALGTPAIVSDGVPEDLVVDNVNGLRYPYGNIAELAEKYRYILSHPEVRARLSEAARITAGNFSWEDSAAQLQASLTGLIPSPAKGLGRFEVTQPSHS